jgi:hypothetical protein
MKKNGMEFTQNLSLDDARVGWRTSTRRVGSREICRALDAWLEKNEPKTKKKRPFGRY